MRKLSNEDIKECRELILKGVTYNELSKRYGVSSQAIQQRVTYQYRKRRKPIPLTLQLKQENSKLKQENEFLHGIIKKAGIDVTKELEAIGR